MATRGEFITLEGIEGVGKTTAMDTVASMIMHNLFGRCCGAIWLSLVSSRRPTSGTSPVSEPVSPTRSTRE